MFRTNTLKRKLAAGQQAIGVWSHAASPMLAELLGQAGFDTVLIDDEHGVAGLHQTLGQLQAIAATPATALVRAPWNDHVYLKRVLDMGTEGVMVPSVNSAEEARAVVDACWYPPEGKRGAAPYAIRAANFGMDVPNYMERYRDELLIICQIETAQAVEAIPDIAAVPGVDMLFIGPVDLSASIGKLGRFDDPEVKALFARAERAILDSGKWWGTISLPNRTARSLAAEGCHLVMDVTDMSLVREGARETLRAFRGG
ncbi:MAG TPA: aldolase/citrate lyase family protein [Azospirillaceae bacterium]|nr:aldolase/citrate lyase family protein [Azospirillaceae bacterium]